jgi:hypothetical protein
MPSLKTNPSDPIDPNLKSGPTRMMSGPSRIRAVTLDSPFNEFSTWIYLGTAGDINITQWDGTTITIPGLIAGVWHPIAAIQINTSGTTASNILWAS